MLSNVVFTVDRLVSPASLAWSRFFSFPFGQSALEDLSWSQLPQLGQGFAFGSRLLFSARCRFSSSLAAFRFAFDFSRFSSAFFRAFSRLIRSLAVNGSSRKGDNINNHIAAIIAT